MVHIKAREDIDIPVVDFFSFVFDNMPATQMPKVAYFNGLDTKERITFGQLKADALALSRGLRDPKSPWGGLKRNQIACIFGANSIKVPVLVFGLLQAGAGITPSNPAYTVRELAHQIKQTSSVLLIAHSSMLDTAIAAAEECGLPKNRIILIDDGVKGFATISQIVARGHELTDDDVGGRVVFTEDDIKKKAVLLPFSSGTTGVPKGVSLTHYGLVSNVCIWSHVESATKKPPLPADVVETRVCFIPLFHMAGIMVFLCMAPKEGAGVCVFPRFDMEKVLEAWEKYRVSRVLLVPPIAVVLSKQDLSKYDFSAMRLVECGSAPLGVEVEAIMHEKLGVPIKQVYGGSEVSCTFTAYWYDMEYKPGGVGLPLPNCEIKLVDPDTGALVGPDQPGEAWLKSPSVALGYFGLPEATKESFVDGWFRSGDILVYSSKDNIFRVTDRIKDLIKYNAFQIAPAELDDLLLTHPDIADVCVTGIPSEEHGEVPRAFVQLKPGVPATPAKAAEIIAFLDGKVTAYKRLRGGVEFRDVIPRGATGKLLRRQLRDEMKERMAKGGFKL